MQKNILEIRTILGKAKWLLGIGIVIIIVMPFFLTMPYFCQRFNFSHTGQIGDTIGGITAPFMNLIGAFLVFYALKAQIKANELIQLQIDKDNETKEGENDGQNLNQLYSYLTDSIDKFRFTTLPLQNLKNIDEIETETEYYGGEAFYHLFSQIRCHYHGTQEELHSNQSVSELLSVLKIMDLLLQKLERSTSNNREILRTLIEHLFNYKIITRIRDEEDDSLNLEFCEECQCNHGLPEALKTLILTVRRKVQ